MPSIQINEDAGVRYLQFGAHWIQGAMRINRPWDLELEYTRDMMLPLLLRAGAWPRNVLQVGLGAGSTAKFLHRYRPESKIDVVELDPEVAMTAWQFFRLPDESPRFRVEIGDGYEYIADCRRRFDLILVDGFDSKAEAGRLDSAEFYRNCRARLAPDGMLVANLIGKRRRPREGIERIRRAFGGRVLALPPNEVNTVAIAATGSPIRAAFERLRSSAHCLRSVTGLNLLATVTSLYRTLNDDLRL
ncbi:MAG TPA: fused MFS/spermidine synthase [Burkholderiales bacterium]